MKTYTQVLFLSLAVATIISGAESASSDEFNNVVRRLGKPTLAVSVPATPLPALEKDDSSLKEPKILSPSSLVVERGHSSLVAVAIVPW